MKMFTNTKIFLNFFFFWGKTLKEKLTTLYDFSFTIKDHHKFSFTMAKNKKKSINCIKCTTETPLKLIKKKLFYF